MEIVTGMLKKILFGCRSRVHALTKIKDVFRKNKNLVVPLSIPLETVIAINECGEEVVIYVPKSFCEY